MNYTPTYKQLQEQLHTTNPSYGTSGSKYSDYVLQLSKSLNTRDILDYGCGKSTLQKSLPFPIKQYDPFVAEFASLPQPATLVVCTDVLEHIEPDFLGNVLEDLSKLTLQMAFFQVATRPAKKVLADGRNAHLIQRGMNWWIPQLMQYFDIQNLSNQNNSGFIAILTPFIPKESNVPA
jgi:2-polyprenyl-3-methyl-5-hydroxy-6-metoxy-1,4-benzoquinol methylase